MTLTTAEITQMRTDVETLLPDVGDILSLTQASDGQGGFTDTWGTATANVACRLDPLMGHTMVGSMETMAGAAIQPYSRFTLTVPNGTAITAANRFLLSGTSYNVISLDTGRSWNLCKRMIVEKV